MDRIPTSVPSNRIGTLLKKEWLQILILITPFVLLPCIWGALPDSIPTHWNMRGEVNGHMGKFWGTMFVPLLHIAIALLLGLLPRIDPKQNIREGMQTFRIVRLLLSAFLLLLYILTLGVALGKQIDMQYVMQIALPLLFLALGIYLPRVRPNYFVGVRTPWTLEDPENWRLTHLFTGKLWVISSLSVIPILLIAPSDIALVVLIVYIAIVAVLPIEYSYMYYRRSIQQVPS